MLRLLLFICASADVATSVAAAVDTAVVAVGAAACGCCFSVVIVDVNITGDDPVVVLGAAITLVVTLLMLLLLLLLLLLLKVMRLLVFPFDLWNRISLPAYQLGYSKCLMILINPNEHFLLLLNSYQKLLCLKTSSSARIFQEGNVR